MNKKGIFIAIAIITVSILMSTMYIQKQNRVEVNNENYNESYKDKLIRFHVLANSDSPMDQELKLKVRDNIIENMNSKFEKSSSIEETREIIKENIENMKTIALNEIHKNGKDYDVDIKLEKSNFPTKSYGKFTLPAGEYEAVRVLIGEAKGQNWWCVMFPPLCFVDVVNGVTDTKTEEDMKKYLTEEEYEKIITNKDMKDKEDIKSTEDDIIDGKVVIEEENTIKLKSKIVELIEKYI